MFSQNTWIIIIVIIITVIIVVPWRELEGYCGCSGMATMSAKPTYYVYRPFGDVSSYSDDTQLSSQVVSSDKAPLLPMQDLGWKTGMPYDAFVSSLNMNSWAAGSDPDWKTHSSVPFLKISDISGQFSDPHRVDPGGMTNYGNGGYVRNYGSKCNSNNMVKLSKPDFDWSSFVSGPYGYPNMLSNGLPEIQGPAGEFVNQPCAEANAYNLGVGVL